MCCTGRVSFGSAALQTFDTFTLTPKQGKGIAVHYCFGCLLFLIRNWWEADGLPLLTLFMKRRTKKASNISALGQLLAIRMFPALFPLFIFNFLSNRILSVSWRINHNLHDIAGFYPYVIFLVDPYNKCLLVIVEDAPWLVRCLEGACKVLIWCW